MPATERVFYYPQTAVGPDGSLYISSHYNPSSDPTFSINRIVKVFPDGSSSVLAGVRAACSLWGRTDIYCYPPGFSGDGGPADQARLNNPQGVALAPDGSLYIADSDNNRVRRISPDGIITTVAGNGTAGFSGDGGPATEAWLYAPYAVAFSPDGNLYISDYASTAFGELTPTGSLPQWQGMGLGASAGTGALLLWHK